MIEELMDATGVTCELRSERNDLIFIGKVYRSNGDEVTVMDASSRPVPPVIYNTSVKLIVRGVRRDPTAPLVLTGQICGSTRMIWKIDRLIRFHYSESRESFRQKVPGCEGSVLCVNSIFRPDAAHRASFYHAVPCRIIDVSMTGILFYSREVFEREDWVLLQELTLYPGEAPYVFTCQIARLENLDTREVGYGCRFSAVTEKEKDRLCQSIFKIQRAEISEHRK